MDLVYDRDLLIQVLIFHVPNNTMNCSCGWAELGKSFPKHVVDVYEMALKEKHGRF